MPASTPPRPLSPAAGGPAPLAGALRRRPGTLALALAQRLAEPIRDGRWPPGAKLPTEAEVMAEHGVSRTVVREAIGRLAAEGLVATRHGIGSFVAAAAPGPGGGRGEGMADADPAFRVTAQQLASLHEVIALLELRIGIETEAAALAAQRRSDAQLQAMRQALDAFARAVAEGGDAVAADAQFHAVVAQATQNPHFSQLMAMLGTAAIPRARLAADRVPDSALRPADLRRVNAEHESILDAIAAGDSEGARAAMRTHLANSRERRRRAAQAAAITPPNSYDD